MAIRRDLVDSALKLGFSAVCSVCTHLQEKLANGAEDCGRKSCGGPLRGLDFPEYKGPLDKTHFSYFCLVCSSDRVTHHLLAGTSTRFGLCRFHANTFADLNSEHLIVNPTIIDLENGETIKV